MVGGPHAARSAVCDPAVAAGVVVVVLLVLLTGRFSGDDGRIRTIEARVARAEQQVRELSGRAPTNGVEAKALDDLTARVAKLEAGGSNAGAGGRPGPCQPDGHARRRAQIA